MKPYASFYLIAYALLASTLFVLPFFTFEGYTIVKHTLGELGAQKVPGNWWANGSVVVLSLATVLYATKQLKHFWQPLVVLYFFCATFFCTALYQPAIADMEGLILNYTHDAYHSLFNILSGFAFCLFCFFYIFILKHRRHQWQTFGTLLLALITPLLMLQFPAYRGVFQRVLLMGVFGWLFFALTTYSYKTIQNAAGSSWKHYKK